MADGEARGPVTMELRVSAIEPRPGNRAPRMVDELAASIASKGLLNAILVQLVRDGRSERYVLIAGERRWRAHEKLGRETIVADVYEVDDREAAELAAIDNLERADLTPLEEGELYLDLLERKVAPNVPELAIRIGKTDTHVRQRMRLAKLPAPIRKLVDEGLLDLGAALAIAATPDAVQKKLVGPLQNLAKGSDGGLDLWSWREEGVEGGIPAAAAAARNQKGPRRISREAVAALISEHSHALAIAPFDVTDATLDPKAGPCGSCPKRTGSQGVLVEVLDAADICLDGDCWDRKAEVNAERLTAKAKASGAKVLSATETKKTLVPDYAGRLRTAHSSSWKALDEEVLVGDRQVQVRKLVDEAAPRAIAVDEETGKVVELVDAKAVAAAVRAKAPKSKAAASTSTVGRSSAAANERLKKEQAKREAQRKVGERALGIALKHMVESIESGKLLTDTVLRTMVGAFDSWYEEPAKVAERRGLETKNGLKSCLEAAAAIVDDTDSPAVRTRKLLALVAELHLWHKLHREGVYEQTKGAPTFVALGIDWPAMKRAAEGELKAEADAKAIAKRDGQPAPKKPAKKGGRK